MGGYMVAYKTIIKINIAFYWFQRSKLEFYSTTIINLMSDINFTMLKQIGNVNQKLREKI